jgi:hypothetical protein
MTVWSRTRAQSTIFVTKSAIPASDGWAALSPPSISGASVYHERGWHRRSSAFDLGEFVQHEAEQEAIREMVELRAQGRIVATAMQAARREDFATPPPVIDCDALS